MKMIAVVFCLFGIVLCAAGNEILYTGSTPAGNTVRSFLGIPLSDSIDFIRWKILLSDDVYSLQCNYGISRPNTNGFINGGKKIELKGKLGKEKNYYQLSNGARILKMVEMNPDLLHLLGTENELLVGNAGWSYTLNNFSPAVSDEIYTGARQPILKDSMVFEGRTPCAIPGIIPAGTWCYKLKWHIVLYADAAKNTPSTFKILGTPYYKEGGRSGNWTIITGKNGRIIYQLNDSKENGFLNLLKAGEHILLFTGAQGKLLVGDEDFSYTLNRKK